MTRTAGAQIGCQRQSRFWGLGCPKIYHEAEDTLVPWTAAPGWRLHHVRHRVLPAVFDHRPVVGLVAERGPER
ncbi:hypothetical protein, partial [Thiolapillus sp.]|uniref:hypothetical protein n=1 Tax=Thiolapillus sp. TaxID=2017437 RepID=UPI003AF63FF9